MEKHRPRRGSSTHVYLRVPCLLHRGSYAKQKFLHAPVELLRCVQMRIRRIRLDSFKAFISHYTIGAMSPSTNHLSIGCQLRAVLFDLDGTLVDSYQAITQSVNHVRGLHDQQPLSEPEVRRAVGNGVRHLLQRTVPAGDLDKDVEAFLNHHPTVLLSGTHTLPAAIEILKSLKDQGFQLAVCSNKPLQLTKQLLELLHMDGYFDEVLGPELVERPKPFPDMLVAAMRRLGVSPQQTLYVGDMTIDIETARGAGVVVWVVPTGSHTVETLREAHPDRLMKDLSELRVLTMPAN